jgi:hypothetical protein
VPGLDKFDIEEYIPHKKEEDTEESEDQEDVKEEHSLRGEIAHAVSFLQVYTGVLWFNCCYTAVSVVELFYHENDADLFVFILDSTNKDIFLGNLAFRLV